MSRQRDRIYLRLLSTSALLWTSLILFGCTPSGCLSYNPNATHSEELARMRAAVVGPRTQIPGYSSVPGLQFTGNVTTLVPPVVDTSLQGVGLMREADCSLTEYFLGSYNAMTGSLSVHTTPNYQNYLHSAAQLTTKANVFKNGCAQTMIGSASAQAVYVGKTKSGALIGAGVDYNNRLYIGTLDIAAQTSSMTIVSGVAGAASLAVADLNGDGNNDLVVSDFGGTGDTGGILVMLSNGDGTFATPVRYLSGTRSGAFVIDDFNGDKKLDIVVTSNVVITLPGNGDGTFGSPITATTVSVNNIASTDIDGDGRKDLVSGGGQVLKGNGDGTFSAWSTIPQISGVPVFGDFNNDGKVDIAFNEFGFGGVIICLGKGDGTFTTQPAAYATIYGSQAITATDIDGDGNLDLVIGEGNSGIYGPDENTGGLFTVMMGNGDGTFQAAPIYGLAGASRQSLVYAPQFAFGDFNGDGKVDMLTSANQTGLTFNAGDGKGRFAPGPAIAGTNPGPMTSALMNTDKKLDVVFLDQIPYPGASLAVAFGNGDGTFGPVSHYTVPGGDAAVGTLVTGDFNGDGFTDVIVGNQSGVFFFRNDGSGALKPAVQIDTAVNVATLLATDLNGDGKTDLVVADNSVYTNPVAGSLRVYLGKGDGTFNAATVYKPNFYVSAVAMGDLNKDGKTDLVVSTLDSSHSNGALNVYLGNGDGTFAAPVNTALPDFTATGLAIADIDGDGKADVLQGGCCGLAFTTVHLGNGDGTFSSAPQFANSLSSNQVAAVDLNGDGRPDVVAAIEVLSNGGIEVLLNLGGANPVGSTMTALTVTPNPVTAGQTVTLNATVGNGSGVALTGSVTFTDGAATLGTSALSGGSASLQLSNLSTGTHAITATYSGDSSNAASTSSPVNLVVAAAPVATTTTLSASSLSAVAGASITFSARVAATSGSGSPGGTVSFLDGATVLGTGTLAAGTATYTTSSLSVGSHTITARYEGDSGDLSSTSTAITVAITAMPAPGFTLSLAPASGTVASTGTVTTNVTLTPTNGFNAATSLACSGLPAHTTCSFSPSSLTPASGAVSSTLTITTGVTTASLRGGPEGKEDRTPVPLLASLFSLVLLFPHRRLRRLRRSALLALGIFAILAGTAGCGHRASTPSTGTPPGTSTITVNAVSGSISQSASYSLTVH